MRRPAARGRSRSPHSAPARRPRLVAAALLTSVAVVGAGGCGGHHPRAAALRVERADLRLLAHTLAQLRAPVATEVSAARTAWPSLADGLPRRAGPTLRARVGHAQRSAAALTLPGAVLTEGFLTGPAVSLAGMLKAYVRLAQRGWQHLAQALAAEGQSTARFLRANSPLYIYCVYDGHYNLSLVGKALLNAYAKLGGAPSFGGSLTQSQVEALARAYSTPAVRLQPHPGPTVVV